MAGVGTLAVLATLAGFLLTGGGDDGTERARAAAAPEGAMFTWSPADPAPGEPVTFSARPDLCGATQCAAYEWRLEGDATVLGTGPTLTHTFTAAGPASIELAVVGRQTVDVAPPPPPPAEDKARNQPATATSAEGLGFEAANGNDGDSTTRWASSHADDQAWTVDLGRVRSVDRVQVNWDPAHAATYRILTSLDGETYTAVGPDLEIDSPGEKEHTFPAREARYVRLTGVTRATPYGISFWDFRVYGGEDPPDPPPPPPPPPSQTLWLVGDGMDGPASKTLVGMMSARFDATKDVFVYLGDVYNTGSAPEMTRWWNTWMVGRPWVGRALAVMGNHEYANRASAGGYYSRWADGPLRFLGADITRSPGADPLRFDPEVPGARHWSWTMHGWQPTTFSTMSAVGEERTFGANVRAARDAGTCHIPITHHGPHGATDSAHASETENARWRPLWDDYRGKAAIWIDAHSHVYHRAAIRAPAGAPEVMRFTVGAGGYELRSARSPQPPPGPSGTAEQRAVLNGTAAVLALELSRGRAFWRALDLNGNVRDSGSLTCTPGSV